MNLYRVGSDNKASNALPVDEATLESRLEDILELNPDLVLGRKLLVIGRQILTDTGKRLDLVALDASGRIVVAELKRGYAPREVIAQVIDYAVWLDGLSDKQLEAIYRGYASDHSGGAKSLHQAFEQRFETTFERNADDQVLLVLFAKEFPPEVSRAATFLSERGVSLLCISFEMFKAEQGEKHAGDKRNSWDS